MSTKKRRPPCLEEGCEEPKFRTFHRCYFHWLAKQPMEVQEEAAVDRRARALRRGPERARVPASEWPAGRRWCAGCQWMVPLHYCRGSRCRACASQASHRAAIEKKYLWPPGMTYDRLLEIQGGRCGICRCTPRTRRLAVDHDHQTGYVRGLLCKMCNHDLLGAAHDDIQILRNAVYYLERNPALV